MGNQNSGEWAAKRHRANLMIFLASEIKHGEESRWRKHRSLPKCHGITSSLGVGPGRKWRKHFTLRNGTQSVKSYQTYVKEKASDTLSYDWRSTSLEELRRIKKGIQDKQIQALDTRRLSGRSKAKRHFRRRKKKIREEYGSDMWTLAEKEIPSDGMSIKSTKSAASSFGEPEKIFWKTSRLSLSESEVLRDGKSSGSQNMLWRSSKHIQTFSDDGVIKVKQETFETDYIDSKVATKGSVSSLKVDGRKRRFSRWTFLRHDEKIVKDTERQRQPQRRTPSFRVPPKMYSKYNYNERRPREGPAKGKKAWKLFRENSRESKAEKCSKAKEEEEGESCDCSCCSCNGCQLKEKEKQTDEGSLMLSECEMAPNSEDDTRILYQNGKQWKDDCSEKEPQRPPVYNPEDYAQCLKKWGRKANLGLQLPLYVSQSTGSIEKLSTEIANTIQSKRQSSPSVKSSSSSRNGDLEKQTKKEREMTLKRDKESKGKENVVSGSKNGVVKDLKNPIVTVAPQETEMSLRQFSSVTELLGKLKLDLRLAFPSFVQEFVGDPVDGVTLLLELLRAVQLSQASHQQRCPPQVLRRALLDEHSCLVCLKHCLRCPDASRRLASSSAGLFTLAVCIMSNVTKSRIIALELLTKACEVSGSGHKPVSEALSTLRLRFGEPVRFRFLVGMLNSAGAVELLNAAMKFINAFINTAPSIQQRVYIQAELEQAGFDSKILRKTLPNHSESVKAELNKWDKNYFDVEALEMKVTELGALRDKVQLLEKRIQILQEEKGILQSLEQCLKERCSELEEEVSIKTTTTSLTKSTAHIKPFRNYNAQQSQYINNKNAEKGESTPAEDEGISSSEQELSQDEDCAKGTIPYSNCEQIMPNSKEAKIDYKPFEPIEPKKPVRSPINYPKEKVTSNSTSISNNVRNLKNGKMKETNVDDGNEVNVEEDEEETTIDEVIEELRNIVNDAETEVYGSEKQEDTKQKSYVERKHNAEDFLGKPRQDFERDCLEEAEIVPSGLLPQPPRRTRSLIHIFLTGTEYEDNSKNEFFDDDTDSESSDSLLTAAREKRSSHKNCHHRSLEVSDSYNSSSSINTRTLFIKQQGDYEDDANVKYGFDQSIEEDEKRKHFDETRKMFSDLARKAPGKFHEEKTRGAPVSNHIEKDASYEKSTSFQGASKTSDIAEIPFAKRAAKLVPVPVKRSQTFHIVTPDSGKTCKRTEMKPKPKMGVSGLDLQRNAEFKAKIESRYQNNEYKKNSDRNVCDRYAKKIPRDNGGVSNQYEKTPSPLQRRGSLDGLFFVTEVDRVEPSRERLTRERSHNGRDYQQYPTEPAEVVSEKKNLRSKSLEKMDDGLDSLVDIVFSVDQAKTGRPGKSEWAGEANKNIGPRMRRSLAESSLFNQPPPIPKESVKPPQPAQRTSLKRNNSSSTPLHMPVEIKIAPIQPRQHQLGVYNFAMKSAKSESNLVNCVSPPKRYPPDGSSSPNEFSNGSGGEGLQRKNSKAGDSNGYATPLSKQSRLQKFFGNPKFENSVGSVTPNNTNQKYFESNYACSQTAMEKSPMPRNIQNKTTTQKVKNLITSPKGSKPAEPQQPKLNFFLGTYHQVHPPKSSYLPGDSPSPSSGSSFNNPFLIKRGHGYAGMYSGSRDGPNNGCRSPPPMETNGRQPISTYCSGNNSNKVTDSLSGLY